MKKQGVCVFWEERRSVPAPVGGTPFDKLRGKLSHTILGRALSVPKAGRYSPMSKAGIALFLSFLCFLFSLGLGAVCAFAQQNTFTLDAAIKQAAIDLISEIPQDSKLVVLEFSAPTKTLSNYIMDALIDQFSKSGKRRGLDVIDRQRLEVLLDQIYFEESSYVDENSATALIGHIPGVQTIITGSFQAVGEDTYSLQVMAIQVPTLIRRETSVHIVRMNPPLASLLGRGRWVDETWKDKWLYLGAWAGYGYAFAAGAQMSLQLARGFALTLELGSGAFSYTITHHHTYYGDTVENVQTSAFTVSLFPALTLRPKPTPLSFELYGGPSYNSVDKFGLAVGGSIGWKVGPGILFADVRYGILHLIDPGYAKLIHGGIGYKIGFFDKEQP